MTGMVRRVRKSKRFQEMCAFWRKITNDWIFNLAAMLAYTLLLSSFPLLFLTLVLGDLVLDVLAPQQVVHLQTYLAGLLPNGNQLLVNALYHLHQSSGLLFAFVVVAAIFTGSRFFLTIENCFGVVFRVPSRHPVHQNIMAVLMVLFYALLIPLVLVGSVVPSTLVVLFALDDSNPAVAFAVQLFGAVGAIVAAAILFGVTYLVVPNLHRRPHHVWRGTLTAAGLLVIYEALFPLFIHLILRPATYGATIGLVVAVLLFFYYLALILLLGAEIDAWALGLRDAPGDIALMMHRMEPFHQRDPQASDPNHSGAALTPRMPPWPSDEEPATRKPIRR